VVNAGALLIVRHQQLVGSSAVVQVALAVTCLVVLVRLAPRIHTRVDLKGQLATSTVSQMAFMLLAIAAGWPLLAFTHLVGHGLYKAARFMAAGGAITTRSVTRRLEQQGSSVGMGPRLLGAAGLAVLSAALGLALGQEVLAALSVIGAGAIAMWWHRTASPVPQPLVTVALLAGSLALYSLVLAALGALLNDELPLSTPTTPWFAMAFAVGVTTLGNTLSTVRRDQHVSVHRTEVTQPVLRHEVAA
jgi:NADH:ubiquinone oxidoreductase subunit 5 (subunit L)/multisubunit Na+/H+ antiporter MnhA subunit